MAFLDEIATYVAAGSTNFTVGTNIFKGQSPSNAPDTIITIYQTPGPSPQRGLNSSTSPLFERPGIQILSRSTSYPTAETNAQTVYSRLASVVDSTLSGTRYLSIDAQQSPFSIGPDENDRHRIVCNFSTYKEY